MNILITGNLSSLAISLVKEFAKENNKIIVAADGAENLGIKLRNVSIHTISPSEGVFRDTLPSYGLDVVIYISIREEQLYDESDLKTGYQLDGLRNTLEMCKKEKLKHFFYISSTEVYGKTAELSEDIVPVPASINGYTLLAGEQYCRIFHDSYNLNITILRLPNVYGPDERCGLLYRVIKDCRNKNEILFPACEDASVSFLHTGDVVDLVKRATDEIYSPEAIVINLSSSKPIKFSELSELLKKYYPNVTFKFQDEMVLFTRPAVMSVAKRLYHWIDGYNLSNEIEKIVDLFEERPAPSKSNLEVGLRKLLNSQMILKWIELVFGGLLTHFLNQMTGTLIQFKYIDFRLLFVVIMGSVYGIQFGLYAAFFVTLSILYSWFQTGFDWALLIYNVGNWFPFALYFSVGLITGYNHDKTDNQVLNEQKQSSLIYEKYSFLYGVYNDIRKLKDEFREQLIGYKDSFGKIFTITRELDQLQEQAVYLRALGILEDLMQNNSIAIYTLEGNGVYARLEVNSSSLNDILAKSLKLSDYPELLPSIERGEIFQNIVLLPNYPAYVAPVLNNSYPFNVPVAIIVIWSVKFEQYSTYYYNLFKVICGLIQASLVRASLFLDANYEKTYLPSTRILNHSAFMDVLGIRAEMKKNKISDYGLIVVDITENDVQEIYSKISQGIRPADVIGQRNDGNYYILLPQANKLTTNNVIDRLDNLGIKGRLIETNQALFD